MQYAVKGGIGDFLQSLPFMVGHPEHKYVVASHYDDVVGFFSELGVEVTEVPLGKLWHVPVCPRQTYFDKNPFPRVKPLFLGDRPTVGIHLKCAAYTDAGVTRFGFPPKSLPVELVRAISSPYYRLVLFGSPDELDDIGSVTGAYRMYEDGAVSSLARVAECTALVGSDSAFKTMSSMLRIPTIVLHGDYVDHHRDYRFINPYVRDGVMSVYRYKNMDTELDAAAEFCKKELDRICSNSRT